jgi:hypothetical protein
MLEIGKTVVSIELITSKFTCNLTECKGACCVTGDSGAPLESREAEILSEIYPLLKPYLRDEAIKSIEDQGTSVVDIERDIVTPLNNGKECVYTVFENGIARCAIEKAYNDGIIGFRKPISCYLYPVRVKKYSGFETVNYDKWDICQPAKILGKRLNTPVYCFVKDALIQKYGDEWFRLLDETAKTIKREMNPE